ncbi:MAG: DUF1896 family protein [Ferruginibacter sp.]
MQQTLIKKLHEYIRDNNPDLLLQLEEDRKVTEYLSAKISTVNALMKQPENGTPAYIIEDACMDVLTQDLRPSKFNYICNLLHEEFESTYNQLQESGTLKFEVINLISQCQSVFTDLNFSEENEDNKFLRYAILGTIGEYLECVTSGNENVKDELQQSTKTEG